MKSKIIDISMIEGKVVLTLENQWKIAVPLTDIPEAKVGMEFEIQLLRDIP